MGDPELPRPIVAIFGYFAAKLLVTVVLLAASVVNPDVRKLPPIGISLALLAVAQFMVLLGMERRLEKGRRLGEAVCVAGRVVAVLLCLFAPMLWIVGVPVAATGLILLYLNGLALAALRSREVREWFAAKSPGPGEL